MFAMEVADLVGMTFSAAFRGPVSGDSDAIVLVAGSEKYAFFHNQDCCEIVEIIDICGDLSDLIGSPLLRAEIRTNSEDAPPENVYTDDSYTWSFLELATIKGSVTVRWFGTSNGHYSEDVSLHMLGKE